MLRTYVYKCTGCHKKFERRLPSGSVIDSQKCDCGKPAVVVIQAVHSRWVGGKPSSQR